MPSDDVRETHLRDQAIAFSEEKFAEFHGLYHIISMMSGTTGDELVAECVKVFSPVITQKAEEATEEDKLKMIINMTAFLFYAIDRMHGSSSE